MRNNPVHPEALDAVTRIDTHPFKMTAEDRVRIISDCYQPTLVNLRAQIAELEFKYLKEQGKAVEFRFRSGVIITLSTEQVKPTTWMERFWCLFFGTDYQNLFLTERHARVLIMEHLLEITRQREEAGVALSTALSKVIRMEASIIKAYWDPILKAPNHKIGCDIETIPGRNWDNNPGMTCSCGFASVEKFLQKKGDIQ